MGPLHFMEETPQHFHQVPSHWEHPEAERSKCPFSLEMTV